MKDNHEITNEFKPQVPSAYAAAMRLAQSIARLTMYDHECGDCGRPADQMNPDCEDHEPFVPSDDDDAALVVNSLIDEARKLAAEHKEWMAEQSGDVATAYRQGAKELQEDGEIEVDDGAVVSEGDDAGAYVAAWIWVADADAGIEDETDDEFETEEEAEQAEAEHDEEK